MQLKRLVESALAEDVGQEDVTTNGIIPPDLFGTARIYAKQPLVVSGHEAAEEVFAQLGAEYKPSCTEGAVLNPGDDIARVVGSYRSLLTGERLALNFLMRLCGIATHTRAVVDGLNARFRVVDTRKTTPNLRALERHAVRVGGGHNHRFALYDGILIKENHIAVAGSVSEAVSRARAHAHHLMKIEIEVETLEQLKDALDAGADVIMLDNMNDSKLRKAVEINAGRALLEASGNMDRERIHRIQDIGLDVVSMGGLIHQATWADISMRIVPEQSV